MLAQPRQSIMLHVLTLSCCDVAVLCVPYRTLRGLTARACVWIGAYNRLFGTAPPSEYSCTTVKRLCRRSELKASRSAALLLLLEVYSYQRNMAAGSVTAGRRSPHAHHSSCAALHTRQQTQCIVTWSQCSTAVASNAVGAHLSACVTRRLWCLEGRLSHPSCNKPLCPACLVACTGGLMPMLRRALSASPALGAANLTSPRSCLATAVLCVCGRMSQAAASPRCAATAGG